MDPARGDFELPQELEMPFDHYAGVPDDDDSVQLVQMLNLHNGLVRFREKDLARMSPETKQLLLNDMAVALGLRPFCATC